MTTYLEPSFFIIGERKCGTSSLYRYLVAHPNVLPCALKEPNFFGKGVDYVQQNIAEYWSMFPAKDSEATIEFSWPELNKQGILYHEDVVVERKTGINYITGEASANTFYEVNPQLVHQYLPNIKLILLFRNPVERAFSHHRMYQRFQAEGRDLGFAVQDFKTDMLAELAKLEKGESGHYLSPSIYLPQLKNWVNTFGKASIRVYFAEDLGNPQKGAMLLTDLQNFLGLPCHDYTGILKKRYNVAPKSKIPAKANNLLQTFFKPHNRLLQHYLGKDLPASWDI